MIPMGHGQRSEDIGFGRILKYWPLLVSIFTAGAWYQSASSTREILSIIKNQTDDHEGRIIRLEDAILYLKEIVAHQHGDK